MPGEVSAFFLPADRYSHADASRPIPFDSPWPADSNETLPDSGGHLPTKVSLSFLLLKARAMHTARNIHHSIPLDRQIPMHHVLMLSDRWLKGYPNICTCVPQASTFKLWATDCYRHADTSRPIPFDSPCRAESNETLPDSQAGGHLPPEISAFFILLTSIAMRTLQNLYHLIPLTERNSTHPVPTLSDHWLKGYSFFCTLVP